MDYLTLATLLLSSYEATMKILAARKQNREMTPEEEAAYDAHVAARFNSPEWQPSQPENPPS